MNGERFPFFKKKKKQKKEEKNTPVWMPKSGNKLHFFVSMVSGLLFFAESLEITGMIL